MAGETEGRNIFISYRRDDTEGEAGRLYDDLVRAYGDDSVFMDVAGIQPGVDFRKAIDSNVGSCGVLLAVIGPTWGTITGSDGTRRLDNPNDYVRLEIGSALKRGIPVIPVLVHDSRMPALEQLPDDLKDLRYRNSVELSHARWNSDVALLISALKSYVTVKKDQEGQTVHATVPVQLPAPQIQPPDAPAKKSSMPLILGIGAAVLALAVVAFVYLHGNNGQTQPPQPGGGGSVTPATNPAEAALLGKWKNSVDVSGEDELVQLSIIDFGGQLMVEAWGKCGDRLCGWGSRKATLNGAEAVTGSWQLRNTPKETKLERSASISVTPAANGLQVAVKNVYRQADGQTRSVYNQLLFVKAQ